MAIPAPTVPAAASGLAIDERALGSLRAAASARPDKALKVAAREFEALFMNQVLKSMRESLPKDGLFSSHATENYTQMLDRELSRAVSAKGTGLAAMIEKQLSRAMAPKAEGAKAAAAGTAAGAVTATGAAASKAYGPLPARPAATSVSATTPASRTKPVAVATGTAAPGNAASPAAGEATGLPRDPRSFLSAVASIAQGPASAVGLSPVFVAAQAALESGWGKREIRNADGSSAHNLFGVKAGAGWQGATADVLTTEYENGVAVKRVEKFRAYGSYAEGLADYVRLLADNPRYRTAVANGQDARGFATALQRAGYATDPAYGDKLARLIEQARSLAGAG